MIGIIDSGLGGLAIAAEIRRRLPDSDVLYFADTAHMPYDRRPAAVIQGHALQGAGYLLDAGAEVIVLSCHIVAGVAGTFLEENLRVPVFSVAKETVAAALTSSRKHAFGVLASPVVVESRFYEENIQSQCAEARVYAVPAPLLTALAEEGWIKKPETAMMVKKHLHPLKIRQIDTLILGCNHLRLFQKMIARKAGARICIVQGAVPLAQRVHSFFEAASDLDTVPGRKGGLRVIVTEKTTHHEKNAKRFLGRNVTIETDTGVYRRTFL